MKRRVCIAGKAATAGIFLCPPNSNHQREILPTFQRPISLNRTESSNLPWAASSCENRVLWPGGRSRIGLNWRRIVDQALYFIGFGWWSQHSLVADFL
jgi:hypothetical protein